MSTKRHTTRNFNNSNNRFNSKNILPTVVSLPALGSVLQGGYFAGQISTAQNGVANYNLVISPLSTGKTTAKTWKTAATTTTGTTSVIDGPTNSANMNNASHPAAQFCEGLSIGGFTDWYLPAFYELEVCYYNFRPSGGAGQSTAHGPNPYAVPPRASNYTASVPPVTTIPNWANGSETFGVNNYWTSTELSATNARAIYFGNGQQGTYSKTYSTNARAIRRIAI